MNALQLLTILLGIAGFAGGAVGYFAKGRGDAIIAYQSKQNELLKDDVARSEKTIAAVTAERDRLLAENSTLTKLAEGSRLDGVAKDMRENTKVVRELIQYMQTREANGSS
jgi:hypothetical protein